MLHLTTYCLTYCTRIGSMPIRRHTFGIMADDTDRLSEKTLCCLHIPRFAQERIHQIALVIDGSIEVAPLSMHFDVRAHQHTRISLLARAALFAIGRPRNGANRASQSLTAS